MHSAVLAGGASSRFGGAPKGLERVGGERILDRVVGTIVAATNQSPILVANTSEAGSWIEGLRVVSDVLPNCGSLGGIYTAVEAVDEPVMVVAWDMPFLTPDLLEKLMASSEGYDVMVPESDGPLGFEPLCAVYGPGCASHIRSSLEDEDYRTTAFHEHVKVGRLEREKVNEFGDPGRLFFNVNTREDLNRAEGMWREQG